MLDVTGFAAPSPFLVEPGIQAVPPAAPALSETQRRAIVRRVG